MYIRLNSIANLSNSIVANSIYGGDCGSLTSTVTANANNIIEDGSCATSALSVDPKLGPLVLTGDLPRHDLLSGSPAINAGDNTVCMAAPINNLDQRGLSRPIGVACDLGSIEFQPSSFFVIPLQNGQPVIIEL